MQELSKSNQVIELVKKMGVLRPRDLEAHSIPGANVSEMHSLAEAAKRMLRGLVCLLSALRFHDLTTQNPFQVWIAIDVDAHAPKPDGLPLRIVRFSGAALSSFIEEHNIEGVTVRVYSPAKTVADCFKYRNKIGINGAAVPGPGIFGLQYVHTPNGRQGASIHLSGKPISGYAIPETACGRVAAWIWHRDIGNCGTGCADYQL